MSEGKGETQAAIEPKVAQLVGLECPIPNHVVSSHFTEHEDGHACDAAEQEKEAAMEVHYVLPITSKGYIDALVLLVCHDLAVFLPGTLIANILGIGGGNGVLSIIVLFVVGFDLNL